MAEPVVYIAQEPTPFLQNGVPKYKDLSSAQRYGRIVYLLDQTDMPSQDPWYARNKMFAALDSFDPKNDFLTVVGGDPISLALAMAVLGAMGHEEISYLRWDRERTPDGERTSGGFYTPVLVPLV